MSSNIKNLKFTKSGFFITFEGGEGSGKTTQSKLLHNYLQQHKIESILTREPGGTPTAEKFRDILLNKNIRLENESQLMLHFASRIEHVTNVIRPALAEGKVVICDRFLDSTLAYQHYGHGINKDIILEMHKVLLNDIQPDLTFMLNLSPEDYIRRNADKDSSQDRYENLDMNYHINVLKGFQEIAHQNKSRMRLIDPVGTISEIQNIILSKLIEIL